jgi:tetratricopeptide (TPR) repeat protein
VLRLGDAIARFVMSRGHTEVIGYLGEALERAGEADIDLRARGHQVVAQLTTLLLHKDPAELPGAKRHAERALELALETGNAVVEARALSCLFVAAYIAGDRVEAQQLAAESVALARQVGDAQLVGELLNFATIDASGAEIRQAHEEALASFRASGDVLYAASELHSLAGLDLVDGQTATARARLEQAISLVESIGDEMFLYGFRSDLALMLLIEGDYERAAPLLRQCLLVARRTGVLLDVSQVIFGSACTAAVAGQHELAARLFGAADTDLRAATADASIRWTEPEQKLAEREQSTLREHMGTDRFEAGFAYGTGLSRVAAVELAMSGGGAERFATNSR